MTDQADEFLRRHGMAPAAPTDAADAFLRKHGLDQPPEVEAPGMFEGTGRAFLSGATADFDDEALGLVSKDWQESSRAKKKAFAEESPWTSAIAKGAGAAAGMVLPASWLLRTGRITQATMNAMNTMRGGAATGVAYGALDRAGTAASGDSVGERLKEASGYNSSGVAPAIDAATGGAGAWVGSQVGRLLGSVADNRNRIGQIVALHGDPQARGAGMVADSVRREGLTDLAPVRQQMWGDTNFGRSRMTPEGYQRAVLDYSDLVNSGTDPNEAIRRVVANIAGDAQRLADHHGGVTSQRALEGHVRSAVDRFESANRMPVQLNESLSMASGQEAGRGPISKQYQAINKLPGDDETFANVERFVAGRQRGQQDRVAQLFNRELQDARPIREVIDELEARTGASNDLYRPVIERFNIDPAKRQALRNALEDFDAEWNQNLGVPTPMNRSLLPHARAFAHDVTNTGQDIQMPVWKQPLRKETLEDGTVYHVRADRQPVLKSDGSRELRTVKMGDVIERQGYDDLAHAIDARASLNAAIATARRSDPGVVPRLMDMKRSLDARLRQLAPEWAEVNDARAGAGALQRAYEDGIGLNVNATGRGLINVERVLGQYATGSPEQIQLFRRGLAHQLENMVMRQGRSHDVAKLFDRPKTVELLRRVMGPEFVSELEAFTRRAAHATWTHGATKGSQSADVLSHAENMRGISRLLASAGRALNNPFATAGHLAEVGAQGLDRHARDASLRLLSANTTDPRRFLQALDEIERAMQAQLPAPHTNAGDQIRYLSPFIASGQATQLSDQR